MGLLNTLTILDDYKEALKEEHRAMEAYKYSYGLVDGTFPGNEEMLKKVDTIFGDFGHCMDYQKRVLLFYILYNLRLNPDFVNRSMDKLNDHSTKSYLYVQDALDNLKTACGMELEYKFYLPNKSNGDISEEDYKKMLRLAKGYDIACVEDFLVKNSVFTNECLDNEYDVGHIVSVNKDELDKVGISDGVVHIPKVYNGGTALIAIHNLVNYSLVMNRENINNEKIVSGEEMALFYELLYKSSNGFIKCNIPYNEYSKRLLQQYKQEPFIDQVKKLERIMK